MVEEVAVGALRAVLRFLGYILVEVLLELVFLTPGNLILGALTKSQVKADGIWVFVVSGVFWGIVGTGVYLLVTI